MRAKDVIKIAAALAIVVLLFHAWNSQSMGGPVPYNAAGLSFEDDYEDDYEMSMSAPGMPASLLATSADLLPKPSAAAADFAKFAPKNVGAHNFLTPSQFIGLDTQGSSLRNANRDLRAAPIIPKRDVGPWLASTIDPDVYRNPIFG